MIVKPISALFFCYAAFTTANTEIDISKDVVKQDNQYQLVQVGEHKSQNLTLEYSGQSSVRISEPGSSFIKVHFSQLNIEPEDYVEIRSDSGERYRYTSEDMPMDDSGLWALSVDGDNATVTLYHKGQGVSDGASVENVVIDKISRGFSDREMEERQADRTESVCGRNDWRDAQCYRSSDPNKYTASRAVARLLINKNGRTYYCTGWRVANRSDAMITNEHCIENQSHVNGTEVQFNYRRSNCGSGGNTRTVRVRGDRLLVTNGRYDVTLFTIRNPSSVSQFGALTLDVRAPRRNEQIYIPQHPGGRPSKISVNSDQDNGACRVNAINSELRYYCDTEGGSSGSPVLAASSNRVIGLHHTGGCYNDAERIDRIWPIISPYF